MMVRENGGQNWTEGQPVVTTTKGKNWESLLLKKEIYFP